MMNRRRFYDLCIDFIDSQCLDCGGLGHCIRNEVVRTHADKIKKCESWRKISEFKEIGESQGMEETTN